MLKKFICTIFIIMIAMPAMAQQSNNPEGYQTLKDYRESIDYSCETDSDCEVKNIGNCCGYHPGCTNKGAKNDPAFVKQTCQANKMFGVCGFNDILGCKCIENRCTDNQDTPEMYE